MCLEKELIICYETQQEPQLRLVWGRTRVSLGSTRRIRPIKEMRAWNASEGGNGWDPLEVHVTYSFGGISSVKTILWVRRAILDREGSESYFSAHQRFSPHRPLDLGRLDASIKSPLETYLNTGTVSETIEGIQSLQFVADTFCLQRLRKILARATNLRTDFSAFQCLNCRVYVPEECRWDACSFKPPGRRTPYAHICTKCGGTSQECSCMECLPRHVFDCEPSPV